MPMRPPSRPLSAILSHAFFAQQVGRRHAAVLEIDLRRVAGVLAHLVFQPRHHVAGRGGGHDEGADALLAGRLVGDGHHDSQVTMLATGDELLDAVEHVGVAVFDTGGGGLQATGFAAHVRFGQAEGAELLAARQRHQETLPLLGVAVGHEDGTDGAVVDADHGAGGAVAGGDLFQDDGQRQVVEPGAVPLVRHGHAVAAQVGQAAQRGGGEGVALVPRRGVRRHFGLHIGAHGILHGAVVIGQQHAGTLVGCTTGGSMPHCGLVRCRASMP